MASRDECIEYLAKGRGNETQRRLAELRLEYSEVGSIRTKELAFLQEHDRLYPVMLPTQASGRTSYLKPNLSGFSKKCINPSCPKGHHEKVEACWSSMDCIRPDKGSFWIEHDLNAVEHVIYCLKLGWIERLNDLKRGVDIHTPVTCDLFSLPYPSNFYDPHKALEDTSWRTTVRWQGKDDPRRTLAKNFTYGGQYFYVRLSRRGEKARYPYRIYQGLWYNPSFVYTMPHIHSYKVLNEEGELVTPNFEELAIRFVESTVDIQHKKAEEMERYRRSKVSRGLYGARRVAWFSNSESAKELFNHTIQSTVASYIKESCVLLDKAYPESYIVHDKHDALKWAFYYKGDDYRAEELEMLEESKRICQRVLSYNNLEAPITATFKIIRREEDETNR